MRRNDLLQGKVRLPVYFRHGGCRTTYSRAADHSRTHDIATVPPKLAGELKFIKRNEYLKSKQVAQSPSSLLQICAECEEFSYKYLIVLTIPRHWQESDQVLEEYYHSLSVFFNLRGLDQLKLPAELINTVLEHLVNRKLLSPANVDLLMGSGVVDALVLGHTNSAVSAASLESIAASGIALKGLVLQNMVKLTDEVFARIVAGCTALVHVDLSFNCAITAPAVTNAIASLPALRRFVMQRGRTCIGRVEATSKTLEELRLPTCGQLRELVLQCPKLVHLDLQDCNDLLRIEWSLAEPSTLRHVNLRSCISLEAASLGAFLPHCPQVTVLSTVSTSSLCSDSLYLYNGALSVRGIWPTVAPKMPLVTELVLSNCRELNDDDILHITKNMPDLKLFFLAGARSVATTVYLSDVCLHHIAANLHKLETIALPPYVSSADALEALVRANPNLRTVDFAENKAFHDDAVEVVLVNCKQLYALSLNDCRLLSDGAFSVLSDTKPSRDGPKPKPEAELQIGRTIQNLGLRNLGLTDAALRLITGRCAVLSAIDLHGNLHVTDQGVIRLVTARGSTLKRLTLAGCIMLTDATVQAIQHRCTILTHLDLYGTSLVTAPAVWALLQAIPSLEVFNADPSHLAFLTEQLNTYNAAHSPPLRVRMGATRSE